MHSTKTVCWVYCWALRGLWEESQSRDDVFHVKIKCELCVPDCAGYSFWQQRPQQVPENGSESQLLNLQFGQGRFVSAPHSIPWGNLTGHQRGYLQPMQMISLWQHPLAGGSDREEGLSLSPLCTGREAIPPHTTPCNAAAGCQQWARKIG